MPTPQNQHPQTLGERPPRRRTPSHYLNRAENDPLFEVSEWAVTGAGDALPQRRSGASASVDRGGGGPCLARGGGEDRGHGPADAARFVLFYLANLGRNF